MIFWLLATLVAATHGSDLFGIFRSNINQYYKSLGHLQLDLQNELTRSSPLNPQNYILHMDKTCDSSCHNNIEKLFGSVHYQYIHSEYIIITYTPLQTIQRATMNNPHLLAIYPFLSTMKVDAHVDKVVSACAAATSHKTVNFLMTLVPISTSTLSQLHATIVTSLASIAHTYEQLLDFDLSGFAEHQQRAISVQTSCVLAPSVLSILTAQPEILFIDERKPAFVTNYWAKGVLQSGGYSEIPFTSMGLTGKGQIIGVSDTGLDLTNGYFYDPNNTVAGPNHRKVVHYTAFKDSSDVTGGHGTHVASVVAGKAYENFGDYQRYNGVAEDARITFFDIGLSSDPALAESIFPPSDYTTIYQDMYANGAFIMTHSWGTCSSSLYDPYALQVDTFLYNHPDVLILYSAGNDGSGQCGGSTCVSDTNCGSQVTCISSPATFKNGLTVGNSLNDAQSWASILDSPVNSVIYNVNELLSDSSQGSVCSKRIKPELTGPGSWVVGAMATAGSTAYHNDITKKAGTSQATPAVAGAAAIIRQYFIDGYYCTDPRVTVTPDKIRCGFTPTGALLKAMLIHSTQPLERILSVPNINTDFGRSYGFASLPGSGLVPDYAQGYGRVQLDTVLHNGTSSKNPLSLFVIGDMNTSSPRYAFINSTTTSLSYKFITSATPSPVKITLVYYDPPVSIASGASDAVQNRLTISVSGYQTLAQLQQQKHSSGYTDINTVSVISIPSPSPSFTYSVTVRATALPLGAQPFALVITGDIVKFTSTPLAQSLASSHKSIEDVPFYPAIIALAVFSSIIFFVNAPLWIIYCMKHPLFGKKAGA